MDLLNPKTALFFVVLAMLCDGAYAIAADGVAGRMSSSPRDLGIVRIGSGVVYPALAGTAVSS